VSRRAWECQLSETVYFQRRLLQRRLPDLVTRRHYDCPVHPMFAPQAAPQRR
jgi:hypothetical protein